MAENSKIEWTDHTFNPWRGCTNVSPGCKNCYAEKLSHRNPAALGEWGPDGKRVVAAESYWRQPIKWNRDAACLNTFDCANGDHSDVCPQQDRPRVFCASLGDVFEDRAELRGQRRRLCDLIDETPNLDWLLLTKRPENVRDLVPPMWRDRLPQNVWLGTSVEDQQRADERIPHLLRVPAAVRFLSCEPLLGPVDLSKIVTYSYGASYYERNVLTGSEWQCMWDGGGGTVLGLPSIDWVIVGGESGHNARPMHPQWARDIRDQCLAADVPFFFKQWGEWRNGSGGEVRAAVLTNGRAVIPDTRDGRKQLDREIGGQWNRFAPVTMSRVGKKTAGRLLDGREWNQFPQLSTLNSQP